LAVLAVAVMLERQLTEGLAMWVLLAQKILAVVLAVTLLVLAPQLRVVLEALAW
jgi:membrane protein YdbS with pleckstrin-like domain